MLSDRVIEWGSRQFFSLVHRNTLVYNACWEDPKLDREAMQLGPDDTVLMITSAGCNALDYALDAPARIDTVDLNPRQNALLELKIAAVRALDYDAFFSLFGEGKLPGFRHVYRQRLRPWLSREARAVWDRQQDYFDGDHPGSGFYYRGSSGFFARWMNRYIDAVGVRDAIQACFSADSLDEQAYLYRSVIRGAFWTKAVRSILDWDLPFAFLGVPRSQRRQIEGQFEGGMRRFVEYALETVFTRLPLGDNYFWWLYLNGAYSNVRCPEYLKQHNFLKLKAGLVDRIHVHTGSLMQFLRTRPQRISRFVLLDHMDWMIDGQRPQLASQWQAIFERARADARILWRSAAPRPDFVDTLPVTIRGRPARVGEALVYDRELASRLHARDRVHTYGSFAVAALARGVAC